MYRAKPFVIVPFGVLLFAAGIAITWQPNTVQFWVWATASGIALAVGASILVAHGPRPDTTLEEAVKMILGAARWTGPGPTVPFDRIANVVENLTKRAANGGLTIWGMPDLLSGFGARKTALMKIPPHYWRSHRIDLAEFAARQRGVTEPLSIRSLDPPLPDVFRNLQVNGPQIKKLKREWRTRKY
jgi:hypothetical protein